MVEIEAKRDEAERLAALAQSHKIRAAARGACERLLAAKDVAFHRFAPAVQFERYVTKEEVEDFGLKHLTAGEPDERYVVAYKPDMDPPEELVEMAREQEEALQATEEDRRRARAAAEDGARAMERMRSETGGARGASASGSTSKARLEVEARMRATKLETISMTDRVEKRTVGQIQDDTLSAKRPRLADDGDDEA